MILTEELLADGVCQLEDLEHTAKAGACLAEMIGGLAEAIGSENGETVPKAAVVQSLRGLLRISGFNRSQ